MPGRALIVEAVSVEAIGASDAPAETPPVRPPRPQARPSRAETVRHVSRGGRCARDAGVPPRAPARRRHGSTARRSSPRRNATTVVEPGWQAEVDAARPSRARARRRRAASASRSAPRVDPVMLEIFNNLFMTIAEQMGLRAANTAYSVNIKERLDFSCALFDADGNLIANAPHMPVHLGSMGESIKTVIRENAGTDAARRRLRAERPLQRRHAPARHHGDHAGVRRRRAGRSCSTSARAATTPTSAASRPGSMPPDSRPRRRGRRADRQLPAGRRRAAARGGDRARCSRSGRYPARNVAQNLADLRAMIAANEKGVQELRRMVAHFGLDVVHAYMRHVQDNAEESVRRVIDVLQGRRVHATRWTTARVIRVQITHRPARRAARRSTSPAPRAQLPNNFNAPTAVCMAAVLYVFRTLVDDDIPLNAGCLKPLEVIIPEGSHAATRAIRRRWSPATSRPRSASPTRCTARSA